MRLKGYNYSNAGYYFITAVTGNRMPFFGAVFSGEMIVTSPGFIAEEELEKTGELRESVFIDEFIIMPDHVHFILIVSQLQDCSPNCGCVACYAPTENGFFSEISPRPKTVSAIVRSYKSAVTNRCREAGIPDFSWQRGFHDRIIRDQNELDAIRKYIRQNPERWWQRSMNPS